MKQSNILRQYIWIVNVLRRYGKLSLEEINRKWIRDGVADGNPLVRSSFNRHRDAILEMFGIIIECDKSSGYKYYIENPEALTDDSVANWMLSTITVGSMLRDCVPLQDKILLEEIPAGEQYLQTLVEAIRQQTIISVTYRKFGGTAYEVLLCPLAVKLFQRRWYLLAKNKKHVSTYALDRIVSLMPTDKTFKPAKHFSPQKYYAHSYGIVVNDKIKKARILLRAYGKTPDYLRTLPLHASQRETGREADYTDFTLTVCPTPDFINALMSLGDGVEVISPESVRLQMKEALGQAARRYRKRPQRRPAGEDAE